MFARMKAVEEIVEAKATQKKKKKETAECMLYLVERSKMK